MKKSFIKTALTAAIVAVTTFVTFSFKKNKQAFTDNKNQVAEKPFGYRWTRLTDNAAFKKSYNFQLLTHNNQIWAFHPDGNYYSADGKNWTKSALPNSIKNLAFLDYVYFNNTVLGLGHFEGNIEHYTLNTPITQTKDFKTWQTLASKSNLPNRFFYHPVVFRNKIWIYGGTEDGNNYYNDIWTSADGVHWNKESEKVPFSGGSGQQFIVFNNKLYMLDNDVWVSEDGFHWSKVTEKITNATLFGYAPIVFDNKIWLLGCNRNGQFASKVYVSENGKNWEEQDAPWSPRGGIAATVFNGKLYMTGGKYGGLKNGETEFVYSNDVWALEKIK
jgi:hypothetical protein